MRVTTSWGLFPGGRSSAPDLMPFVTLVRWTSVVRLAGAACRRRFR